MQSRYELIRRIAAGGMGEVFVARRVGTADFEKRVALKLLLPHLLASTDLVRRFYAEARLAARMHHPNVVEIFDVGEADGRPFLAMQLVDGVSLSALIKSVRARGAQVPLPLVRLIASGVCEGLAHAHELRDGQGQALRVVHRDVTPSNILVSVAGAVLLTDFGIARVQDSATQSGGLRGKVGYLAPELLRPDTSVDGRSDQWSAAMTLVELLTLENPLRLPTLDGALEALRTFVPPELRGRRPDLSPRAEAALQRALSPVVSERFADVRSFAEAFLDGPVATAPELGRFVRELCGPSPLAVQQEPGAGTRSIATRTMMGTPELPEPKLAPPPRSSRWLLATVVFVLVTVGVGVASLWPADEPPQLAVVTPTEPEPEPPPVEPAPLPVVTAKEEPPAPAKRPEPPARPKRKVRAVAPPAGVTVGYLSADADPWAEVSVDGRVIDRTPFARFPLPTGPHELVFRGPDGREEKRTVTVLSGRTEAVRVDFAKP